jgi:hypothetical protein
MLYPMALQKPLPRKAFSKRVASVLHSHAFPNVTVPVYFSCAYVLNMEAESSQIAAKSPGKVRQVGPYSRPHRLRRLDKRTSLGRYLHDFETGLISHTGGAPSFAIRSLIDTAVGIETQLVLLERAGIKTAHDARTYSGLISAKRNTLKAIGLGPAAEPKTPSLAEYLADKSAAPVPDDPDDEPAPRARAATVQGQESTEPPEGPILPL